VILLDANLLVYAHVSDYAEHERARSWLDRKLGEPARVGLPWESILAFVRLVTNPRVFARPESVKQAWRQVEEWLDAPSAFIPCPTERHRVVLSTLLVQVTRPNLVPDAHLAALAIEHGLVLCSTDGDFARFPGLRWENPLSG
jgi:toxin-antitoxin system PIN domain toxin